MKVLLSIKPEFAFSIFDGTKKFEFRKSIFKRPNIKTVVVYASSPVRKVIGEFTIDKILINSPETIWRETKDFSGITECHFDDYFENRETAYAIKILTVKRYQEPLCLKADFKIYYAPQSYMYIA